MSQIIIKWEDPIHGHSTRSFGTRAEAEAYMDSIGLVVPTPEPQVLPEPVEEEPAEHKKAVVKPAEKHAPKHFKAKKR